ncbi:MAG: hypothetical protein IJS01_10310 [Lentisphaeria bacterium]|nr:hypothetical protein [Lentisphaeria bacterium]
MRISRRKNEGGSVLMEYVILIMLVGAPLVVFMQAGFYSLDGGFSSGVGTIDVFGTPVTVTTPGRMFKFYFQRILTGIALPIP